MDDQIFMKCKFGRAVPKVTEYVMVTMSIVIFSLIFVMVLFRYVFHINLYGMEELILIAAWWLYFAGGSYGSYERSHIMVDFVDEKIKNKMALAKLMIIRSVCTTILSAALTYFSVEFVIWSIQENATTAVLHWSVAYSQIAIVVGFLLMTFYSFYYTIKDIKDLNAIKKDKETTPNMADKGGEN